MSRATSKVDFTAFVMELQNCERDAHDAGLHETGHAINKAIQKAGWERAEQLTKTRRATLRAQPETRE